MLRLKARLIDTMLLAHLVSPDMPKDLGFLGSLYSNKPFHKDQISVNKELYNCRDVDVTAQIAPQLKAIVKQQGLWDTYSLVSVPVAQICLSMTRKGIKIDASQIESVREKILNQQEELEKVLPERLRTSINPVNKRVPAAPGTISPKSGKPLKFVTVPSSEISVPWRSDKAVGEWLYGSKTQGGLELQVQKHLKTGKPTTDKYSLERLQRLAVGESEKLSIAAIKELRSLDETLTTFAKEKTAYGSSIHPHFNVHGTNSGRLSSSGPNAQNIPEALRVIYIPNKVDHYIIQADFSGIENRLTAILAKDTERLARLATPGFSEHKWACEQFFGIPMSEVKKSSDPESAYSKAKHIVHGSNYGLGPRKMSMMYGVNEREVRQLLSKWKASIPKTFNWQEYTAGVAKLNGVLTNPFGRKRWFGSSNYYTESLSFLPQSTAADIILRCMVGLYYDRIDWPLESVMQVCPTFKALPQGANLLVQVHDSLVVEAPKALLDEVVETLSLVMCQPWRELGGHSIPIEVAFGESWGELEVYKKEA